MAFRTNSTHMPTRILSLLSDIERLVLKESPVPTDGTWDNSRMVNYQSGLARLTLSVRSEANRTRHVGSILLQSFDLADRSFCLKANLFWTEGPGASEIVHALYEKPGMNWENEAREIATKWLAGPPAAKLEETATRLEESQEPLAVAS